MKIPGAGAAPQKRTAPNPCWGHAGASKTLPLPEILAPAALKLHFTIALAGDHCAGGL